MQIGEPQRIIEVTPLEEPVPLPREQPSEPVTQPEEEPAYAPTGPAHRDT